MGTKTVLVGVRLFVNGADLTSNNNKIDLQAMCEEKETTNFASQGWKELTAGIFSATLAAEGQWAAGSGGLADLGQVDDALSAALGTTGPWSAMTNTPVAGDIAWSMTALTSKYTIGGAVGDVAPWSASVPSAGPLIRGQVMHPPGTARTSTGTGTIVQVGAVPAGYAMYANLHVIGASGTTPSMTVKVQSAALVGFGSPTDRATFTAATAIGGQSAKIAAPITDQFWRISYTISGTTPSFLLVAVLGLGPA